MRINESFSAPVSTGRPDSTSNAALNGETSSSGNAASSEDLVSLSNATQLISRALTSGSSERAARIQTITAQVQAGTYSVSADTLSSSLLQSMLLGD